VIEAALGIVIGFLIGAHLPHGVLALSSARTVVVCLLFAIASLNLARKDASVIAAAKEFILLALLCVGVVFLEAVGGVPMRGALFVSLTVLMFYRGVLAAAPRVSQ
jgi:hypothetical protein